jgi:hypothetical protein
MDNGDPFCGQKLEETAAGSAADAAAGIVGRQQSNSNLDNPGWLVIMGFPLVNNKRSLAMDSYPGRQCHSC